VGLFPVGAGPGAYDPDWQYMNGTKEVPPPGITRAVLTFKMPTPAGHYEFRLVSGNTSEVLAWSPTVVSGSLMPALSTSALRQTMRGSSVTRTGGSMNGRGHG
jgi:hypothetical protein